MTIAQVYCTVDELIADLDLSGGDLDALFEHVQAASLTVQDRIGYFVPVTETHKFNGGSKTILYVPPLLAITSVINDDDTLTANVDYLLRGGDGPDNRHWPNGPWSSLIPHPDSTLLDTWHNEEDGVQIAGRWGKWEKTAATGAALGAAQADAVGTSLQISDGSKVSPGLIALIGSEQQLVNGVGSPTAAVTTLSSALDASSETVALADGTKVKIGEVIRAEVEQMKVLDINGNTAWVRRAWNRTRAASHASGVSVDVYRTYTVERGVNGTTAAAHDNATAISRYTVPANISFFVRQHAALMLKKAQSAFAGRTGNAELGVTFYNDTYPKFDLDYLEEEYRIYD